jgi:hypothetical protein
VEIAVTTPKNPHRFYIRPPDNFYEMSEEEQLAWTRQVGEDLKAASTAQRAVDSEAVVEDQPGDNH